MRALQLLRERMAELADLEALEMLATWDQMVTMPRQGAQGRAHQLAALSRLSHERATAEEIGQWLAELDGAGLDAIDRDIVRVARRDWERARRVPAQLAAQRASAHVEAQERWRVARQENDFAGFAPALERNVKLARAYGECLSDSDGSVYDALLGDYDYGLDTRTLRELFGSLARELPPLAREASERSPQRSLAIPVAAQKEAVASVLRRVGVERSSWRVDVSPHPFTAWLGRGDTRVTTRYSDEDAESLLSSLHEYGHALYERQVDPDLERTNLGHGTSMSVHESQSKLWENHVARHRAFSELLARELEQAGFAVRAGELHAVLTGVKPSLIRVSADPLTYPLHIIVRFELELALVQGELAVADLPAAWGEGMRRLLGVKVPCDALGCLQDVHWAAGNFGYFPSYALGCVIAAQLWEKIEADLGPRAEDLRRGEVAPIQAWLGEHVHRVGRRLDTVPLVRHATGSDIQTAPFLRYVTPLATGAP